MIHSTSSHESLDNLLTVTNLIKGNLLKLSGAPLSNLQLEVFDNPVKVVAAF